MSTYYRGAADHRGVHENSGIPNRAFAIAAIELDGNAWETLAPIWYQALTTNRHPTARFTTFANNTITVATQLHAAPTIPASPNPVSLTSANEQR